MCLFDKAMQEDKARLSFALQKIGFMGKQFLLPFLKKLLHK